MSLETVLDGGDWRLVFERCLDRWSHRIEIAREGGFHPVLASCEEACSGDWPDSPPLQQLHLESRGPGRAVALLVGMAGRSHWSASVEIDGLRRRALLDFACRAQQPPERLGNRYRILSAGPVHLSEGLVRLDGWELRVERLDGVPWQLDLASETRLLTLAVETSASRTWPATLRWSYAIEPRPTAR